MVAYCLYRLGQNIALSLPVKWSYAIARGICDVRALLAWKDCRAVRANLQAIFPEKSKRQIVALQRLMFRNFAEYLVDFFRFPKVDRAYIQQYVHVENIEYLDQAIAKGKGVILLTAHIGNWELGGAILGLLVYPVWAVALTHKNQKVNTFYNSQRLSKGINVIALGKAVRQCLRLLNQKQIIALVGDRDSTEHGQVVDFFGKPALFPSGAAAFAVKSGAVIVPGFVTRNGDDTFTLRFEPPLEYDAKHYSHNGMHQIMDEYKSIIETYIRHYPEQWYMFRQFWIHEEK